MRRLVEIEVGINPGRRTMKARRHTPGARHTMKARQLQVEVQLDAIEHHISLQVEHQLDPFFTSSLKLNLEGSPYTVYPGTNLLQLVVSHWKWLGFWFNTAIATLGNS